MAKFSSVGDERDPKTPLEKAEKQLERALDGVDAALHRIEAGELDAAVEVPKTYQDLKKALDATFAERKRLDEQRRKSGELGDGDIDFDAAKSQILDSLDRVRRSKSSGTIPE